MPIATAVDPAAMNLPKAPQLRGFLIAEVVARCAVAGIDACHNANCAARAGGQQFLVRGVDRGRWRIPTRTCFPRLPGMTPSGDFHETTGAYWYRPRTPPSDFPGAFPLWASSTLRRS